MARVRAPGDRQLTPTLSPDRWEQIRALFEEIVELDAARRAQRLEAIGARDAELRSILEALLQADSQANAWLAPVESPLGFVPPAAEDVSAQPNEEDGQFARVPLTRRRWLLPVVSVVTLGVGGMAVVRQFDQPAADTEANWRAPPPQPVITAPQPVTAANSYRLVGVNLRGEERALVDIGSRNAGSWGRSALDTAYFAWPKVSPDGKRVAVEVRTGDGGYDIWVYDVPSRSVTRLTHGFTGVKPFGWSSDSRNLVYLAVDDGNIGVTNRVVSQRWDGREPPRLLLQASFPILNVGLGPLDGSAVIRPTGSHYLWSASLRSPGTFGPFAGTAASAADLGMSRDGQLLAYVSDESGQSEIHLLPVSDPSRRVQVSRGGGTQPVWSPDGNYLFYRSPDRMMRATVNRRRLTVERVEALFADIYERHDITNYDVLPGGEELVMIRSRSR